MDSDYSEAFATEAQIAEITLADNMWSSTPCGPTPLDVRQA